LCENDSFESFWTWTVTEVCALVDVALAFVSTAAVIGNSNNVFAIVTFWNVVIAFNAVTDNVSAESNVAATSLVLENSFLSLGTSNEWSTVNSVAADGTISVALAVDAVIVSW
jgi:hypothetical protein